jgi:hypothetical protein
MEERYRALRIIATIYRVLGYITIGLTILAVLGICGMSVLGGTALSSVSQQLGVDSSGGTAGAIFGGIFLSIFAIIYGGLIAISLIAFAEGINLFISIEENTRKTGYLIDAMLNSQRQIPPAQPGS